MQTFLPYFSFGRSACCLDDRRLGKQRVEVYQILRTLAGETSGWRNHPAVRMWGGYERALVVYGVKVCMEWTLRDFEDNLFEQICSYDDDTREFRLPEWLGDERFHASHRSNLLRKDPGHYGQFGWEEPDDLPYYWPTRESGV